MQLCADLLLVSDGEHVTPEMAFTIHLDSVGQQPPVFQTTTPFLKVSQGGKATLGKEQRTGASAEF